MTPVLERTQKAYPDLRAGRFIVLANFESPAQAELFRVVGPDGSAAAREQPSTSVLRSRQETGAGGLHVRLSGPDDVLLFDGRRSKELALVRDWRGYSLLLASVYGPPEGTPLELTVQSGVEVPLRWQRAFHGRPGWNLLRFDLAEIGDAVDLSDVRAVSWRAPQAAGPLELHLDDIILTRNTRYVLGEDAGSGELFVYTEGRRIQVGARDRFELAFADGVIVAWHTGGDENLTARSGLGPWPVPLAEDWADRREVPPAYDDPRLYAEWGSAVATAQRLVEATPFRAVITGQWLYVDSPAAVEGDAPDRERPGHTWQYTVYPTGDVYVQVRSVVRDATWSQPRVGYAVALDGRRGFTRVEAPSSGVATAPTSYALLARGGARQADLLWSIMPAAAMRRQLEVRSADERRVVVVVGDVATTSVVSTADLLRVWPLDIDSAPVAESIAGDYLHPVPVRSTCGGLVNEVPGDLDQDGFNETEGCYELGLAEGVVRFRFDPGGRVRHHPVFRVHGTAGREAWIYADGRIVRDRGRDAEGRLLFTIPPVTTVPVSIEVNTAEPTGRP